MTGRERITIEELENIRIEIDRFVNEKSVVQKVMGFLTFVNILWFFSIVGLCCTVIPCLSIMFGPFIWTLVDYFR